MKFKVVYAKLQTEYFSTGTGNLGTVLNPGSPSNPGTHKGMDLTWTPQGLFVSYKNVSFTIPLANVAGCTFAEKPNLEG